MAKRGKLTDYIKTESSKFNGNPISLAELKLIPYVVDCLLNNRLVNIRHISPADITIINVWKSLGYVDYTQTKFTVTKQFWDFMTQMLWMGYVNNNNYKHGLQGGD